MNQLRDAFDALVTVEQMKDEGLSDVISAGSFASVGIPEKGRSNSMSPAQMKQHQQLVEECARLREQLGLTQQQLAKAATSLAMKKDEKFTLRNKKRMSEGPASRAWGRSKNKESSSSSLSSSSGGGSGSGNGSLSSRSSTGDQTERRNSGEEDEDLAASLLVTTTKQLDQERLKVAILEEELVKVKTAMEGKVDERLNEIARRMNKANQANEVRYKSMLTEWENMKAQLGAAQKTYMRKIEDIKLESAEKMSAMDARVTQLLAMLEGQRAEVEAARQLKAELEESKRNLAVKSDLVQRSSGALASLKAMVEQSKTEKEALAAEKKSLEEKLAEMQQERDALLKEKATRAIENASPPPVPPPPPPPPPVASIASPPSSKKAREARVKMLQQQLDDKPRLDDSAARIDNPIQWRRSGAMAPLREGTSTARGDDAWKSWVAEPYLYDSWTMFQNQVDSRTPEPLILQIKGHAWELGSPSAPPMGDPRHLEFVEPMERVLYYQKFLLHREHVHFVGASTSGEHMVITVEMASEGNQGSPLIALLHLKKATLRALVDMEKTVALPRTVIHLDDYIATEYPGCDLKRVDETAAHELVSQRLIEFENMHLDFNRRVGILYWKSGQTENEAFGNNMSPELDEFLNFFGERVRLKGWTKFRGGLNVKNDETGEYSVYAEFQNFQFMAHVSALLPFRASDEQKLDRKRHIGNDLVVIIFWEGPGSFDASQLVTQMCHVFIVIEKVPADGPVPKYRVGIICRSGVQPFKPYLPAPAVFDADDNFRTWLFMKIINGERATFQARTFLTKTSTARKVLLDKIARDTMAIMDEPASLKIPLQYSRMVVREPFQRLKTVAQFAAVTPTQLSFKKGEEVILFNKVSAEWWNGGVGSKRGEFPSSKVVTLERKEKRKRGKAKDPKSAVSASSEPTIPPSHEITFTLVRGVNLAAKDPTGTSDPYVKLHIVSVNGILEGTQRQSQKIMKTLNPEWNETFSVKILDPMWEMLHIEVFDWDLVGTDDHLGYGELYCSELIAACGGQALELTLEPLPDAKGTDAIVSGSIFIAVNKVTELAPNRPVMSRSITNGLGSSNTEIK